MMYYDALDMPSPKLESEEDLLEHLACHPSEIQYVVDPTLEAYEVVIRADWHALQYISVEALRKLENPVSLCEIALEQNPLALMYIHSTIQTLPEMSAMILKACQRNGLALQYVHSQSEEICLSAVRQNGLALQYVLNQSLPICLAACRQNGLSVKYLDAEFIKTLNAQDVEVLYTEACKQNGLALQYIAQQTDELCLIACTNTTFAFPYVRKQFHDLCMLVVKANGNMLQHVEEQTYEMCKLAVQKNGRALYHVRFQSDELCLIATSQNGLALQYVMNQTEEICLSAVRQNGYALQYVLNPTERICEEAMKQSPLSYKYIKDFSVLNRILRGRLSTAISDENSFKSYLGTNILLCKVFSEVEPTPSDREDQCVVCYESTKFHTVCNHFLCLKCCKALTSLNCPFCRR